MEYNFIKNDVKGNGLLIADLHLSTDERYGPGNGYRTHTQPMMLADRLKELVPQKNIGWIGILGDLLDVATSKPIVNHVLYEFFTKLNNLNIPIFVIVGQHDLQISDYSNTDDIYNKSNVTLLTEYFENIYYAHNAKLIVNDKFSMYFSNFSSPIKYPPEYVDVWLTHCTLGFTPIDEYNEDETRKFGILLCGDIHDHVNYGRSYSIGTPYQHKSFENSEGSIGFLDLSGEEPVFDRLPSDSDTIKFLRLPEPELKVKLKNEKGEEIGDYITQENIMDELLEKTKELGIDHIHNKVDKTNAPNPVNLNFKLLKLSIKNYRSVKEYELDFNKLGKITLLLGQYGSGKSTIFYAIRDILCSDTKTISRRVNHYSKYCELELTLSYEGKVFRIYRKVGSNKLKTFKTEFKFFINDEEVVGDNKRVVEGSLRQELPFIDFIERFIPYSNRSLFTQEVGTELIERCLNLDLFTYYMQEAVELKKIFCKDIDDLSKSIERKRGERDSAISNRDTFYNVLQQHRMGVNESKESLETTKNILFNFRAEKSSLTKSISASESTLNSFKLADKINVDEIDRRVEELYEKKKIYDEYLVKFNELNILQKERESLLNTYKTLNSSLKEELPLPEESKEQLELLINDINNQNNEINIYNQSIVSKRESLKVEIIGLDRVIAGESYTCTACGQLVVKDVSQARNDKAIKEQELNSLPELKPLLDVKSIIDKLSIYDTYEFNNKIKNDLNDIVNKGKEIAEKIKLYDGLETVECPDMSLVKKYNDVKKAYEAYLVAKRVKEESETRLRELDIEINNYLKGALLEEKWNEVETKLRKYDTIEEYEKMVANKELELKAIEDELTLMVDDYEKRLEEVKNYDTYINIMDYNQLDSLPYKLINTVLTSFSNEQFKITTTNVQKNGKEKFNINLFIRAKDNKEWIHYNDASGGQGLLLDLFFYNMIASYIQGIGILVLDETLNAASDSMYIELNDVLSGLNYEKVFVTSHSGQITCQNNTVKVDIDGEGYSSYHIF